MACPPSSSDSGGGWGWARPVCPLGLPQPWQQRREGWLKREQWVLHCAAEDGQRGRRSGSPAAGEMQAAGHDRRAALAHLFDPQVACLPSVYIKSQQLSSTSRRERGDGQPVAAATKAALESKRRC